MPKSSLQSRYAPRHITLEIGLAFASFFLSAALIILLTWPWLLHFSDGFLDHWDPPFHAWKLEVMARKIVAGDWLLRHNDTPLFYPYSGTLHFEAITWPTALVAAALVSLTDWAFTTIYHLVLLLFWSLSAPAMFIFLRTMSLGRLAALAGCIFFTILPYRLSYANEFQMQLAFLIPLFYLLFTRFLHYPTIWRGIALGAFWWFFAVTELYQAVFILFTLPFIVLTFAAVAPQLLTQRRFWCSSAVAAATTLLLLPLMLLPYLHHKTAGAVARSTREVIRHSIQPLSYIVPFGRLYLWQIDAKVEELWGYPTLMIVLLALVAALFWFKSLSHATPQRQRRQWLMVLPLGICLTLFTIITIWLQVSAGAPSRYLLRLWSLLPVAATLATIPFCIVSATQKPARNLLTGLAAAAVFTFFLSFGPTLDLRLPPRISAPNHLYMALYNHTPLLSGFRAACRFGIFVLFFLTCTAACGLDRLILLCVKRVHGWSRRGFATLIALLAVVAVAAESWPTRRFLTFKQVDHIALTPVAQRLCQRTTPYVLAAFPMGNRTWDGTMMYGLLKDRHLSIYGWAGFFPLYSHTIMRLSERGDAPRVASMLQSIWPEVLLWIDRSRPVAAKPSFVAAKPEHYVSETQHGSLVDYVGMFSDHAREVDRDGRFSLMALHAPPAATNVQKYFRSDFVRRLPWAAATLLATNDTVATITFNDSALEPITLRAHEPLSWQNHLRDQPLERSNYNTLTFEASSPLLVLDFELRASAKQAAIP